MLKAKDSKGNLVHIEDSVPGETYYCPDCGSIVIRRMGDKRAHHFAHKKNSRSINCSYTPMSDWHIGWQNFFPKECQEIVVTDKVTGKWKRADVLINKTVIEIQKSKMTKDNKIERVSFYKNLGYDVVWIENRVGIEPPVKGIFGETSLTPFTSFYGVIEPIFKHLYQICKYVVFDYGDSVVVCGGFLKISKDLVKCTKSIVLSKELFVKAISNIDVLDKYMNNLNYLMFYDEINYGGYLKHYLVHVYTKSKFINSSHIDRDLESCYDLIDMIGGYVLLNKNGGYLNESAKNSTYKGFFTIFLSNASCRAKESNFEGFLTKAFSGKDCKVKKVDINIVAEEIIKQKYLLR